jgi:flagellar basal body-associated protein FliL
MEKVTKILNLVIKVLAVIVLSIVVGLSLAMAYIMFAPDNLPKPFYLTYVYPTPGITGKPPTTATSGGSVPVAATPAPTAVPEVTVGGGIMINTGTKIVNLAEPNATKFIRVSIVLEFAPNDPKYAAMTADAKTAYNTTFSTEIVAKEPVIDDVIITMLSTKTFDALYTAAGKEDLRTQLLAKLAERLPGYKLLSLYFTEFVVQ